MSIIYDALKKSQHQRDNRPAYSSTLTQTIFRPKIVRLLKLLMSLMIIFAAGYYLFITTQKAFSTHQSKYETLILNGVFISNNKKLAMINQQLYALGEDVQGMQIVEITENNIKLKNKHATQVLNILAA